MDIFSNFPDNSQIWVYSANRFLTDQEEVFVNQNLKTFVNQWAAHGADLKADAVILNKNFIVLISDENEAKASGCSIDSSVRFIKDLGKELNIDFFNRLSVLIEKDGEYQRVHFSELKKYPDWNVFNTMAKTLGEFKVTWIKNISETIFA
jgi:hypothetical protein